MRFSTKVLPSRSGNVGFLQLNHPKALHALTLDMIYALHDVLSEWHKDPSLAAIVLKSSESKRPAFCAGGDVKSVYQAGIEEPDKCGKGLSNLTGDFFRYEYQVNHAIATSRKPQISIWDGVVMGGGVGLSVHGKYRISTENTIFAMPETAIGLFPDVGSTYWMTNLLNGGIAPYLALTGKRLEASDLIYVGISTHYVPSEKLGELEAALVEAANSDREDHVDFTETNVVAPVLMSFHQDPPTDPSKSFLAENRELIDSTFGGNSRVEDILQNLKELDGEFGRSTLKTLGKMSPTSMKVTLESLGRAKQLSTIGECLQMEYRMSQSCMRPGSDFYEGIRAVLVDKDNSPRWSPSVLEDVTDDIVKEYFVSLVEHDWKIPELSSKL